MQEEITIRAATPEDAKALIEIYGPYVENTAITFEYEVPSVEEFAERMRNILRKYPYLVAIKNGKIAGYAYASAFHTRPAYEWCVETSIYVDKEQKHGGIGRKLYEAMEGILKEMNIKNLYACIAYPEKEDEYLTWDSVRFHERLGYISVGRFPKCGYKFDRWYDMVWMEKMLGEHTENPAPVRRFSEIKR